MPDFSRFLLASDLDGTFFGPHATLLEKNLQAVAYFKAHGGHFTTATGRVVPNINRVIPDCGALFNAPAITSNGAYIYDYATQAPINTTEMNAPVLKTLMLKVEEMNPNIGMRISTDKGFLVNGSRLTPMMQKEISSPHFVGEIIPAKDWDTENAHWYKAVLRGTYEELCAIRDELYPQWDELFEFCSSSPTLFEMEAKGCTKATGVAYVAHLLEKQYGYPITTITVGDQENDLPMLREADISACPENALDSVKAIAKWRLCHHAEGCVAELIQRLEKL